MVVDRTMSIGEIVTTDPGTMGIMLQFGMHCLGCPHAMMESLEMACAAHGADVDELVDQLNAYFASKEEAEK